MARAVLTRTPEGLVVWRPIHSSSVEQFAENALAATLMASLAHDEIDAVCRAQQLLGWTAIYHDGFLSWRTMGAEPA